MKIVRAIAFGLAAALFLPACQVLPAEPSTPAETSLLAEDGLVRVVGQQFIRNGQVYQFVGADLWQAALWGATASGRERLVNELSQLQDLGLRSLRVMVAPSPEQISLNTEGGDKADLLLGLDFLLREMRAREMQAVLYLLPPAQDEQSIDVPWYLSSETQETYLAAIKALLERVNSLTGERYIHDSTIMAWQLPAMIASAANTAEEYSRWLVETVQFIKRQDPVHLVSASGQELGLERQYLQTQASAATHPAIDYLNLRLPVGLSAPPSAQGTPGIEASSLAASSIKAKAEILEYLQIARALDKPVVVNLVIDRNPATDLYRELFGMIETQALLKTPITASHISLSTEPDTVVWSPAEPSLPPDIEFLKLLTEHAKAMATVH